MLSSPSSVIVGIILSLLVGACLIFGARMWWLKLKEDWVRETGESAKPEWMPKRTLRFFPPQSWDKWTIGQYCIYFVGGIGLVLVALASYVVFFGIVAPIVLGQ